MTVDNCVGSDPLSQGTSSPTFMSEVPSWRLTLEEGMEEEQSARRQALTSHLMASTLHVDAVETVHESERNPDGSNSQEIGSPEILNEENEVPTASTSRKSTATESPSRGKRALGVLDLQKSVPPGLRPRE